jgi:hypothetical protein
MSNFPLYDSLNKDIPKKDLTTEEKENIINIIPKLDQNGINMLYVIIILFARKNQTKAIADCFENNKIIFKGKKDVNDDMTFDFKWNFNEFPTKLKHIINKFIKLHSATMIEEHGRSLTKEQYDNK